MEKLLRELGTNFNISGKELIIIEALAKNRHNAHNLSKLTKIPIGRIYGHLNSLISKKLIERSEKKPYIYFIEDLDQNIIEFLKQDFESTVQKQNRMMNYLENRTKNFEEIEIIGSGDDFSFRTIQLVKESRFVKNIVRHGSVPFALYPEKSNDFLKVRNIIVANRDTLSHTTPEMTFMLYRTHEEAYKKGKKMEYIVEKSALDFHFKLIREKLGSAFFRKMKAEIKQRLKKHNVSIYVLDEFIPMQSFITQQKVFLSVIHHRHTQGVIITNQSAVELYNSYFEEMKGRCKDILTVLKNI